MSRVIAVDWDGTLVEYHGYQGPMIYGAAVPRMLVRVKRWIKEGHEVIIFTSRVSEEHDVIRVRQERETIAYALHEMGLPPLQITAIKLLRITEFHDDRAIRIERNTGICREDLGAF